MVAGIYEVILQIKKQLNTTLHYMQPGTKVKFLGSPLQDIPARDGVFTVEMYEPAGPVFNTHMVALVELKEGWVPLSSVKRIEDSDNHYTTLQ